MNVRPAFCGSVATIGALLLAACGSGQQPTSAAASSPPGASIATAIDRSIDHALARADSRLDTQDIDISTDASQLQPEAKISPRGDLLIDGKAVALTPAQRAQMLAYRAQLVAIARQGIAIGKQGATLGVNAAGTAIAGAFSGESEQQIHAKVEAQASGIRQAAAKICDRLPSLMASQRQLATDVPAFKPYATLTQAKIDECREHALHSEAD